MCVFIPLFSILASFEVTEVGAMEAGRTPQSLSFINCKIKGPKTSADWVYCEE